MISIATLKAHLSSCLKSVKSGREVWITDRGRPVARIVPLTGKQAGREDLVQAGLLRPPLRRPPPSFWDRVPRRDLKDSGATRALLEERDSAR
jgi:prevent-host-death family protein